MPSLVGVDAAVVAAGWGTGKTAACRDQEEQLEVLPGRSPLGVMPSLEGEDAAGGTGMTARRAHVPEEQLDAAAAASSVRC